MYHGGLVHIVGGFLWKTALALGVIGLIAGPGAAAVAGKTAASVIGTGGGVVVSSLHQAGTSFQQGKAVGDAVQPLGPVMGGAPPAAPANPKTQAKKSSLVGPTVVFPQIKATLPASLLPSN